MRYLNKVSDGGEQAFSSSIATRITRSQVKTLQHTMFPFT